jgi:amino-acid N-acetyltransferase
MTVPALASLETSTSQTGRPLDHPGLSLRNGASDDAPAIHALVHRYLVEGHLLPRTLSDVTQHAGRFLVVHDDDGELVACGELAPLSEHIAEVRSLIVDRSVRDRGLGQLIVNEIAERAEDEGFTQLCAFTHGPRFFTRLGFSIVPHTWLPEKIAADCVSCPLFRRCGQFAMRRDLDARRPVNGKRTLLG